MPDSPPALATERLRGTRSSQLSLWLFGGCLLLVLLGTSVWLGQQQRTLRQQLVRSELQAQATEYAYALQASAYAYARFLINLQHSLTGNPQQDQRSLTEHWTAAIRSPQFASAHVLRLLVPGQDARVDQALRQHASRQASSVHVYAYPQPQGLLVVALPPLNTAQATVSDSPVVAVELRHTDWLREVGHLTGLTDLQVSAHNTDAADPLPPAGLQLRWNDSAPQLDILTDVLDQPMRLAFTAKTQSNGLMAPAASPAPWLMLGLAWLALLLWMAWLARSSRATQQRLAHYLAYAARSQQRYQAFIGHPFLPTAEIHRSDGRFLAVSPCLSQLLGYMPEAMKRLTLAALTHPDDLGKLQALHTPLAPYSGHHYGKADNIRLLHREGHTVWVDVFRLGYAQQASGELPLSAPSDNDQLLRERELIVLLDQSQARELQKQLQQRIERSQQISEQLPVGLCVADSQLRIVLMNQRYREFSGIADRTPPRNLNEWWQQAITRPNYRAALQERWHRLTSEAVAATGVLAPLELTIDGCDGRPPRTLELTGTLLNELLVLTLVDLTRYKSAEEEIHRLAFYDRTTGLPNRRLLLDRLEQAQAGSQRKGWYGALLLVNLDKFRTLRDTKGHAFGDTMQREAAARLRQLLPQEQTVACTDTAEFTVMLTQLATSEHESVRLCKDIGHRIIDALQQPFAFDGRLSYPGVNLGITLFRGMHPSAQELLRHTDIALYQARLSGQVKPHFFDPDIQALASARAALEDDIRAGIALGQFELHFQPQVRDHHLTGAEVLLRWRQSDQGFVSPDRFITTAEQSDLIVPLGAWVINQACKQLAQWAGRPETAHLTLSVNVSPKQFKQDDFVHSVLQALTHTGAPADRLVIELTEGVLLENIEQAIERMGQLKGYGVDFSLDDFGTGYSSLSYLQKLPLAELKIDRCFVQNINSSANDASIVRSIIGLGHSLGLRVIAEGIETAEQVDSLRTWGCLRWQGFLIGKPQPIDALEQYLRLQRPQEHGR